MRNFIELHDEDNEPTLVNIDYIEKVFVNIDGLTTVELKDGYYRSRESYDEVAELIRGAGVCIDKGDPRLDTKSPLTMDDLKHMVGEPVWNSNTRDWWLIHYCLNYPDLEEVIVYNKDGVQESWAEKDLIKTPLYRMKQGMMFISGDNIEVHE